MLPDVHYSFLNKITAPVDIEKAKRSIGTLGGGNHFIEVDKDTRGNYWLVIHTGSRHLGLNSKLLPKNLLMKIARKHILATIRYVPKKLSRN